MPLRQLGGPFIDLVGKRTCQLRLRSTLMAVGFKGSRWFLCGRRFLLSPLAISLTDFICPQVLTLLPKIPLLVYNKDKRKC